RLGGVEGRPGGAIRRGPCGRTASLSGRLSGCFGTRHRAKCAVPAGGVQGRQNRFDLASERAHISLHSKIVLEISRTGMEVPSGRDAMERYGFIDTDSHVIEPDDIWDKSLDPKFRDDAPVTRVGYKTDENGFGFFNDVTVGDCNQPIGFFGTTSVMPDLGE